MTPDEEDRIRRAEEIQRYTENRCEALEKENKELKKEISVLLSCSSCPENKGGYICEKEYNNKCLAQKIEYIKELKEENEELKENLSNKAGVNHSLVEQLADKDIEVAELKEQIEKMRCGNSYAVSDNHSNSVPCYTVYECKHCSKRN